jgi:hypothetical protein
MAGRDDAPGLGWRAMTGPGAVLHPSYGMVSIVKPHEYVFFNVFSL